MMSLYYLRAFNDLEDPIYACYYGNTTHPLYGRCLICPSFSRCDLLLKQINQLKSLVDEPIKVTITIEDDD